jgi:predicted DNA-binding transcriptional regulator
MKTIKTFDDGLVHIEFEKSNDFTKLVDAIVVSPAQYATWTEAFIDELIEKRWVDYLIAIAPPPEPVEPEEADVVEGEE